MTTNFTLSTVNGGITDAALAWSRRLTKLTGNVNRKLKVTSVCRRRTENVCCELVPAKAHERNAGGSNFPPYKRGTVTPNANDSVVD